MEKLYFSIDIVKNFGVKMQVYGEPFSDLDEYDNGLRLRLFQSFDTGPLKEFIRSIESSTMCFTEDRYGCHYCFFSMKQHMGAGGGGTIIIGPWVETLLDSVDIDNMLQKTGIPYHLKPELERYFNHIPLISFRQYWEGLLLTIATYLHASENKFNITYLQFEPGDSLAEYSPKQDDSLSFHLIENLYHDEDAFLDTIKAGDTRRALQCMAKLRQYRPPQRTPQKIRDGKDYLLVMNTLARKTVQNSSVHPMHIHTVSTTFAQKIEAAERESELLSISETMIRSYCSLVQKYSLQKYSEVVRNVINFVEFNLKEPLSLNLLAGQFNIVPAYLSRHFAAETGMTLTSFINMKRLEHARHLLNGSAMYIEEVAEYCGYQDMNYFIRLFKRKYGKTPKKYRDEVREGSIKP
jgi:AraC-like DNA-binding protein